MRRFALILLSVALLSSCVVQKRITTPEAGRWIIQKLGVGTGTISTLPEQIQLRDRFAVTDHELVAVVNVAPGTVSRTIHARWYMPDETAPLLGSASMVLPPASTNARLSFANAQDWKPSPYLLTIQVTEGEDEHPLSTGNFPFFIGMTDEAIQAYRDARSDAQARALEQSEQLATLDPQELALREKASEILETGNPLFVLREDFNDDGKEDLMFLDTRGQPPFRRSRDPAVVLSASVRGVAVLQEDGTPLIQYIEEKGQCVLRNIAGIVGSPMRANTPVHLTFTPSRRLVVSWKDGGNACVVYFQGNTTLVNKETPQCIVSP